MPHAPSRSNRNKPTIHMGTIIYMHTISYYNTILVLGARTEELHNLYSSPSIIRMMKSRRMRWAGHVAGIREKRNIHRILVGKPQGKRSLERPNCRWVDNIEMDLRWNGVIWSGSSGSG
jgi:hypothetical protein